MATTSTAVLSSSSPRAQSRLLPFFKGGVLIALGVVIFRAVLLDLAHDWWTEDSLSYGLLVPPLAIYIAWLRRGQIAAHPGTEDARGLSLIALGGLMLITGKLGAEFFLSRLSFVVVLTGVIWTFWGKERLRLLGFPLVVLATMVPLPNLVYNAIGIPLQLFASTMATRIIQAAGGSVFQDGNIIQLPNISLGVVEACSGLRSLPAVCIGSLLVGFLRLKRIRTRVLLFVLAVPLAILVNSLRVTGTAFLATYKEEFALGFYHSFSGWLVFMACFGVLTLLARFLHWSLEKRSVAVRP